jgi:hypothetical protein
LWYWEYALKVAGKIACAWINGGLVKEERKVLAPPSGRAGVRAVY